MSGPFYETGRTTQVRIWIDPETHVNRAPQKTNQSLPIAGPMVTIQYTPIVPHGHRHRPSTCRGANAQGYQLPTDLSGARSETFDRRHGRKKRSWVSSRRSHQDQVHWVCSSQPIFLHPSNTVDLLDSMQDRTLILP